MDQIMRICRAMKWSLDFDQGDAVIIYHFSKAIGTCVHSKTSEKKKTQSETNCNHTAMIQVQDNEALDQAWWQWEWS